MQEHSAHERRVHEREEKGEKKGSGVESPLTPVLVSGKDVPMKVKGILPSVVMTARVLRPV